MWWKKNKWKVIIPVLIVVILAAAFYFGGNSPGSRGWSTIPAGSSASAPETAPVLTDEAPEAPSLTEEAAEPAAEPSQTAEMEQAAPEGSPALEEEPPAQETVDPPAEQEPEVEPGPDTEPEPVTEPASASEADPAPAEEPETPASLPETPEEPEAPAPAEEAPAETEDVPSTVTLSISCAAVLDNMDWLDPAKAELIPADGWILAPVETELAEGESVFDVLLRVTREYRIHFEYSNTPLYDSAYLEGIGNLYELDCGASSGWMYAVNGWFPNYGCSQYFLQPGDVVSFQYTCNMGKDIGGSNALG